MSRKFNRSFLKMTPEQLEHWTACQRRTSIVPARKGQKGQPKRTDNKLRSDIKNQIEERD